MRGQGCGCTVEILGVPCTPIVAALSCDDSEVS